MIKQQLPNSTQPHPQSPFLIKLALFKQLPTTIKWHLLEAIRQAKTVAGAASAVGLVEGSEGIFSKNFNIENECGCN